MRVTDDSGRVCFDDSRIVRKRARKGALILGLLLVLIAAWAGTAQAGAGDDPPATAVPLRAAVPLAAGTLIRCNPHPASQLQTSILSIDLYVQDVVNLYGADAKLLFDGRQLQVVDADPATAGTQIQPLSGFLSPDFVIKKIADNTAGFAWYANTQLNPSNPVSGSGAIARVTFQALEAGSFSLPFASNYKLTDRLGTTIPATTQTCIVSFWGPINLTIRRDGATTNTLTWSYLGSDVHHAEVWRSTTNPYLSPDGNGSSQIQPGPSAGQTSFADTGAGPEQNQFYTARAVKSDGITKSAPSNRVAAFHFTLTPGAGEGLTSD